MCGPICHLLASIITACMVRPERLHLSIWMSVFHAGYPGGIFDPLGYSKGNMEVRSQPSAHHRPFTRDLFCGPTPHAAVSEEGGVLTGAVCAGAQDEGDQERSPGHAWSAWLLCTGRLSCRLS